MTNLYLHFSWFFFLFIASLLFLFLSLFISFSFSSISITFDIFSSWFMKLSISITFDIFSSWFSFVVLLISSVIMYYSYFYMMPYYKSIYFIWLTFFFVVSMLIVVNFSNLFFLMLGWDGLGLVSFFLIVFYQNFSSISSGLFTVLMNRLGDCFFIISVSMMLFLSPSLWDSFSDISYFILVFLLMSFSTKSAIYPFSPWLPLAMAAPTPISALVHSSTLVTAGLYLMMRFSYILYSNSFLMTIFLVMSVFTSFYAGMNAIFEVDLKKLIALSTLSHLGFIGMAFFSGLLYLAFFHLLVHALFKSVLFMAMGDIMTNLSHSQDSRFLSSGLKLTPFSFYIMSVSLVNLLGLPSLSGFYSKDLVLESLSYSFVSYSILFLVYLNLFFTYYYTYKLFLFSYNSSKLTPFFMLNLPSVFHSILLFLMSVFSVVFGFLWVNYINIFLLHQMVPSVLKLVPYFFNLFVFFYSFLVVGMYLPSNKIYSYYFSNMMFLSVVCMTLMSNFFLKGLFFTVKTLEYGFLNFFINSSFSAFFSSFSAFFSKITSLNVLVVTFLFMISLFLSFI